MTSYINQISSLGPKVWYRFNETAGTPVNSGSLVNTLTNNNLLLNEQTDVDGRCVYFNGSNAYASLSSWSPFAVFNDKSYTIEAWFKTGENRTSTKTIYFNNRSDTNIAGQQLYIASSTDGTGNGGKVLFNSTRGINFTLTSPNTYDDDKWHHVVITMNTTSQKMYIDGQLVTSASNNISTATFDYDQGANRLIGASRGGVSGTIRTFFLGRIDEFALYDYELSAQQVLDNYNAGASVVFPDIPGTASALSVMPAWSVETVLPADPMTASSLFVETLPSNFDYVDGIQKIISDLSPHQWIKFDATTDFTSTDPFGTLKNYGSGGGSFANYALGDARRQLGPAQEPRVELRLGSGSGSTQSGFATATNSAFFSDEVSDNNFSIGIWFKMPSGINTSEKQIFGYSGGTHPAINLKVTNKKVQFNVQTSHTTYTHTETNNISEAVWHLAVIRLDLANTTLKYYLDGTEVYSETAVQGTRTTPTSFSFGKSGGNGTDTTSSFQEIAHFFVTSYSAATQSVITNLWNAGTRQNQAKGVMTFPTLKFQNKYDDYVDSLSPIQKLGFNELSGNILENTGSNVNVPFTIQGTSYTRGTSVPTKNRYGYNFTNKNTYISGAYAAPTNTFSDNTMTISVYAKLPTVSGSDNQILALYGAGNNAGSGIGLTIGADASGPLLRIIPTVNPATWATFASNNTSYFGDWHLYTAVRNGSSVKFYIDGKVIASGTYTAYNFTDNGFIAIGGGETVWLGQAAATVDKYVDEFAAFDYALTDQQIFEMWQTIELDRATASSTLVMPTNIAGTGYTDTPAPMTASALAVDPTQTDEINLVADSFDAFIEFLLPNYGGNVVIDANYGHEAATANAVFHDPQYNIGEFNAADHMNASALMVHPAAIAAGRISVSTAVGSALFVMPGIVTIKGARVFADPMRSQAIFPLPPAYIQLADDDWYVRLYAGHFDGDKEPIQALLSSLPNQQTIAPTQGGFLTFFDDVNTDITPTSATNTIESEIGQFAYVEPDEYDFDSEGDLIPLDTTGNLARATISRQSTSPQPILSAGLYDPFERKAVRVTNIEFPFPGTDKGFSERPYNLEFSIRTVKSDQILAHGYYSSPSATSTRRIIGVVGLSDGKLYLTQDRYTPATLTIRGGGTGSTTAPHPKNFINRAQYLLGRTNIADGNWHHVVIQQGFGSETLRTQIWVDGKLDRQIIVPGPTPGIDGTNEVRPYIMGFNSNDNLLNSDFETSAWNFYPGRFIDSRSIGLNYSAYVKSKPIKVEPFTATVTTPQDHKAAGNRARALMLFWWPKTGQGGDIVGSGGRGTIDEGLYGGRDESTFDKTLVTIDLPGDIPQQYHGWDIFPVDVTGQFGTGYTRGQFYQSDMLKPEVWTSSDGYRDLNTGARRYIDLMNDIDISQFDAIFFRNFPEQSQELDSYVREDLADSYFGLAEEDLYRDFLASLRAAVDTGISLYITNAKLALDLGIIDNYEVVSDMRESDFNPTSNFVNNKFTTEAISKREYGVWRDTNKNNKFRIVNTLPDLTNEAGYIWKDWMLYEPDAVLELGDPARPFIALEYRANGLNVGDEFIMSDSSYKSYDYEATPFNNVKAGKIIAAFSNTINQNGVEVANPYRNYATIIALEPGTVLRDKPVGGKILVNFTERLSSWRRKSSIDTLGVDLIQDEWINLAYNTGQITLAKRDELLAASYNLDRRLAAAAGNAQQIAIINELKKWDSNGEYILVQKNVLDDPTGAGTEKDGLGDGVRRARVNKVNKKGTFSTQSVTSTSFWFSFEYSFQYPRLQVTVPSMLTRGFRWLSDRTVDEGLVIRVEPMTAIATEIPNVVTVADKDRTVYATAMVANARIIHAPGYALADVSNTTLPLTATAKFGDFVKNIAADLFTATANIVQPRISGIEEDEIVVYINHVDPILYLREDVIK